MRITAPTRYSMPKYIWPGLADCWVRDATMFVMARVTSRMTNRTKKSMLKSAVINIDK